MTADIQLHEFKAFPKMPRLSREIVVSEKLDGTNAQVYITEDGDFLTGSRNRWITPQNDNYGFSRWAHEHKEELMLLGPGRHYGEWWGSGIQRGYGLKGNDKRFSLFNTQRWCLHNETPGTLDIQDFSRNQLLVKYQERLPKCCGLVPVLYKGDFDAEEIDGQVGRLRDFGSLAVDGYMNPEGIVVFHTAANQCFKKTLEHDESPKSLVA